METNSNNAISDSEKKEAKQLSLKELFKKIREDKKISLKALSEKSGVSLRNLEKIESGEWSQLPASIYVKDFLSKCADILGEDEKIFSELYDKELSLKKFEKKDDAAKRTIKMPFIITPKITAQAIFLTFILMIASYFVFQINYLLGSPKLVAVSPENDIITRSKEIEVSGSTQPDNRVLINDNDIFVDGNGFFSVSIPLQPGINTIKIKATNRLNKDYIIIRRIILEE
ncbi:helix-turn-helix domain-containing protein [Candidatus Azambacteria bacterium]|nr:helix-turn-helix domain-containing protein [Candidatus Azambacteria bacterium]